MKGLYLNVSAAEAQIRRTDDALGVQTEVCARDWFGHRVVVGRHAAPDATAPFVELPEERALVAASGWFVKDGRRGTLVEFAQTWRARGALAAAREIDDGSYVIAIVQPDKVILVGDRYGLHPHYVRWEDRARVAPFPLAISDGRDSDPILSPLLSKLGFLFGNATSFSGIERVSPGCVRVADDERSYESYSFRESSGANALPLMRSGLQRLLTDDAILPLSGGLDSRFILAALDQVIPRGYTFGPSNSGDRPVARGFRDCFGDYWEFSLLDFEYPARVRSRIREMFDGVCPRPFAELGVVYRALAERWGFGSRFLDGYLGDVFSRGTFFKYRGVKGSLAKAFACDVPENFDAVGLLRRKYRLSPKELEWVVAQYEQYSQRFDVEARRRMVLFQVVYGHGARFALNGGTTISSQYFAPVQPFMLHQVIAELMGIDPGRSVSYEAVRDVWGPTKAMYRSPRTYSGFRPDWNPHLSRLAVLLVKGLGRAGLWRTSVGYESELPLIRWREERSR